MCQNKRRVAYTEKILVTSGFERLFRLFHSCDAADPEDSSHGGPSGVLGVMPRQPRSAISDQHQTRTLGLSPAGESRRPIEPESHVSLSAV